MTNMDAKSFYDKSAEKYEQEYRSRFVDLIFEHLINENLPLKINLNILDAGGGIGRFAIPLAKKGHSVVLTDISPKMINSAKKLIKEQNIQNISTLEESVTDMATQSAETFDIIIMMNGVLDYCGNPLAALKESSRVLKKNGLLMGSVNNRLIYGTTHFLLTSPNIKEFNKLMKTGNYYHHLPIHNFSVNELRHLISKVDLSILDILGPTNLLRKWEYQKAITKINIEDLLKIQLEYARKKEYINNSNDFFYIAKK